MSIKLMSLAWAHPAVTDATEKLVLLALADAANDDGVCWPSIGTIAQRTCISTRSVQRWIGILQDKRLVLVPSSKGGKGKTNQFWLRLSVPDEQAELPFSNDDATQERVTPVTPFQSKGDASDTLSKGERVTPVTPFEGSSKGERVTPMTRKGDAGVTQTVKNRQKGGVRARATPHSLPDGWCVNDQDRAFASERGWSDRQIDHEAAAFEAYHRAGSGPGKGLSKDWHASWRTWVLNQHRFGGARSGLPPPQLPPKPMDDAERERLLAWDRDRKARQGIP